MDTPFLKKLLKILSVGLIYYGCARFGLLLALGHSNASPVWPPSGFAFAAILIFGYETWPGILIGAIVANVVVFLHNGVTDLHGSLLVSAFIAGGNTLEALAGYYFIRGFRAQHILTRTRDFSLFIFTALIMCLVSCSIGTISIFEAKIIEPENFRNVWFTWWMGDVSGVIILTPVLLSFHNFFTNKFVFPKPVNFAIITGVLLIYLLALFNGQLDDLRGRTTIYLLLIILTWVVFSIAQWQSSLLVIMTAVISIWYTLHGKGPFILNSQNDSLLGLQVFLCVMAIVMMFLSTTLFERRESETQLKNLNVNLENAQIELEETMKVKENFLANMSHEIRTPMNAIVGFTELLRKTNLDEEQKQYVEAVKTSGENLLVIINSILDFSKIRSGKIIFERTELKLSILVEVVRTLLDPKAKEKNVGLIISMDKNVPDNFFGDPTRLSQILINLVDNAVKFTERGEVKVNISLLSEDDKIIRLRFEIRDTGIGIPENKLSSVFEGFTQASNETTRKYGGTGLGLAIVKELVELQNGDIHVESKYGKGSLFCVTLPFHKNHHPSKTIATKPDMEFVRELQAVKILLVEDNELNQILVQKILGDFSNQPSIARNGKEAISKILEEKFDMILLDIQLPEMDGYEVAGYIRTQLSPPNSTIPIIAVTAHAMPEEEEKCFRIGMDAYLSKPFTKNELLKKIIQALDNPRIETTGWSA
jgi:signal transduction histidine kinase/CheY-like chemotaxis protein